MIAEKLQVFQNIRDRDIEQFLRERAVLFENRRWSSTYLVVSQLESIQSASIEAYFTLSNKTFMLGDKVSNRKKRSLGNGIVQPGGLYHGILISQMGKYIGHRYTSPITATEILDYAMEIAQQVNSRVACNNVFLECDIHRVRLQELYEDYGFRELQRNERFVQLFCKI